MIPKFLQSEVVPFASIEVVPAPVRRVISDEDATNQRPGFVPPDTHFCEYDREQKRGRSIAVCGAAVDKWNLSNQPTCAACRGLLDVSAEEMFGEETPGPLAPARVELDYFQIVVDAARAANARHYPTK